MTSFFEPGTWPVLYPSGENGAGCSVFDQSGSEEFQAQMEEIAIGLLWNWTDRIFGTRTEVIRPQRVATPWRPSTFEGMGPPAAYAELGGTVGYGWLPVYLASGSFLNLRCGTHHSVVCPCGPEGLKAIHLPGPVSGVSEIKIEGEVLDPEAYRLDHGHILIRQDGEPFPAFQDLYAAPGDPETWTITFTRGVPVPKGGQLAAGTLACELGKAALRDESCSLPDRVQSIARQGVSMELVQTTFEEYTEGKTGVWSIDSWIGSVRRPRDYVGVASPDTLGIGVRGTSRWDLGTYR